MKKIDRCPFGFKVDLHFNAFEFLSACDLEFSRMQLFKTQLEHEIDPTGNLQASRAGSLDFLKVVNLTIAISFLIYVLWSVIWVI